ncbi:MAG TPA: extracellular solute-binding protein, partial [Halanaerobiales bacterium]|nr:extracellular solute-binding protein [Halanaerobiales bacterium]
MGGDILSPDLTKADGYLNSEETITAIEMLCELYKNRGMEGFLPGSIPTSEGFAAGNYAMIVGGPWQFPQLEGEDSDFRIYTSLFPEGKAGSVQVLGGEDIVMFRNATLNEERKEAAWEFMKFMTGEFAQTKMAEVGQIPVNKQAAESPVVKESRYLEIFLEQIETARARPPIPEWTQIDDIFSDYVMLAVVGKLSAEEAMNEAAQNIDKLLSN